MMINNATSLGWNQVCDGQGGFNRYIQLGHYVNCNDEILRDTSIKTSLCGIMQKYQVVNFEVDEVSSATYFSYQLTLPEKDYHELFDAMQKASTWVMLVRPRLFCFWLFHSIAFIGLFT